MNESAQFRKTLSQAIKPASGFSMSARQYRFIARRILSLKKPRVLVVGAGNDAAFWHHCSGGNLMLVENDPAWASRIEGEIIRPNYRGKVGVWLKKIKVPRTIARPWDIVLVDGPTGYSASCIGRQEPIAWAAQFGNLIFVHDYNRPWERKLCDHYLGAPTKVLPFKRDSNDRLLAVFERNPSIPPASARTRKDKSSRQEIRLRQKV